MTTLNPIEAFAEHVVSLVEAKLKAATPKTFSFITAFDNLLSVLTPYLAHIPWQTVVTDAVAVLGTRFNIPAADQTIIVNAVMQFINTYVTLSKPAS